VIHCGVRYNITFDEISGDARLVGSVEAVEMEIEFSTTDASALFLGKCTRISPTPKDTMSRFGILMA
jgi:hypothetical protein